MDLVDAGVVIVARRNGMPHRAARIGVVFAGGAAFAGAAGPGLLRMAVNLRVGASTRA